MSEDKSLLEENKLLKERLAGEFDIDLTSKSGLNSVLEKIVEQSRRVTNSIGGSIYLKVRGEKKLCFFVAQNEVVRSYDFKVHTLPINRESIAGWVASTRETLNIPNVYEIDIFKEYRFNDSFDREVQVLGYDFKTRSMLTAPLLGNEDYLVGVIQLINSRDNGNIVPFTKDHEKILMHYGSIAALAITNQQLYQTEKKRKLIFAHALATAIEERDLYTGGHTKRVAEYSKAIARHLGLKPGDVEDVELAAIIHDVGKIGIEDGILNKPDKLTKEEFDTIKEHTIKGLHIVRDVSEFDEVKSGILSHHERHDGKGYPNGLSGDDISVIAGIISVADTFDAMVSDRPYRKGLDHDAALYEIQKGSGTQFKREVVDAFLEAHKRGEINSI